MMVLGRQLTTDGRSEDIAPAHERLRLFAPVVTSPGQLALDTDPPTPAEPSPDRPD